jgi:signal transduction histidine kinase
VRRRGLALVAGVALPTVLLGAGWLAASLREREALRREQVQALVRAADAVRGAIDESLEELRLREDRRPFYLYNPLYSPPELIALNDPLATSPLAGAPDDRRVLGYFQVEPGGRVRTPYGETEREATVGERGRRVTELAGSAPFAPLRALAYANADPLSNPAADSSPLFAGSPSREREREIETPAPPRPRRRVAPRPSSSGSSYGTSPSWVRDALSSLSGSDPSSSTPTPSPPPAPPPAPQRQVLVPEGPLTTNLDTWNQAVFNDIQQAQAGDVEANTRVQQRGRSAPRTRRNTIGWGVVADNSQAPLPPQVQLAAPAAPVAAPEPAPEPPQPQATPLARPRPQRSVTPAPAPPEPPPPAEPPRPDEVEVDYTPMAWAVVGDDVVVLHRVVSHEGTAVVQGAILDGRYVVDEWIPTLVARHASASVPPRVVERAGAGAECAIRRPASALLANVELCYTPETVRQAVAGVRDDLALQFAALAGLVLAVTLAGLAMARAARRAEELSAQKSAFVSSVSHELRTPLTTIRLHAEMLRDGLVPEPKRDRFHRQLVNEAVRLSNLVENVLELSRLEEGRRVLRPQLGDLRVAVAGAVDGHRPLVADKGFELRGPVGEEPVTILFDAQAVAQIVVNLLDNAVKYGRGAEARIEVDVAPAGDGAAIVVRDHGPGIPPAERALVFERFHRVESPDRAHLPGTGIGLSLVRELARAHGGDAEVREAPGGGCEVRVTLRGEISQGGQSEVSS